MSLTDDDVREILKLIDESDLDELHIETENFVLHVSKGAGGDGASLTPLMGVREASPTRTPERPEEPISDGATTIDSPMLGTFYRAERPGADPFVDVGTEVEPDTIVAIIEVMKMMNSVPAGIAGTIAEVCCDNAALVEYGQPLFRVDPK
ncbi:MAG TPA: biotin/lipoyl-containing protein [Solirubrobacteraceae bacterium]|nr:biotin/lipoyl-containing protein [Solirubrobacteraceae bacterium]